VDETGFCDVHLPKIYGKLKDKNQKDKHSVLVLSYFHSEGFFISFRDEKNWGNYGELRRLWYGNSVSANRGHRGFTKV